ncbi:MAG: TonB-dependent receptor [Bacteroidota bacterium]
MRKLILMALLLSACASTLLAQQKTISGKVTDAKGETLPNVSVLIKGSRQGTATKQDGTYSLIVPANAKMIVFSSAGYTDEEISIGIKTIINISLTTTEKSLQEVVVVGYGTQKKKAVTSSITKISGESIANAPVTSFDQALAGRASGVQVTLGTGIVNAAPRVRIRGINSLTGGRDPLFVVDGVPMVTGGLSGVANTNPLSDINPNDIESIEVLKDGAATAIFGSRASNGVVMITTKKGRAGKFSVNYDFYAGMSQAFRTPALLNAQEFVTIANEKLTNAGLAPGAFMNAENTNTNWLKQVFKDNGVAQSHTLSLMGGNDKSTYYFSFNYLQQQGIIYTNYARRYNMRASFDHKVNKFVKIGNNITISRTEDNDQNNGGNALSGGMAAALRALPNVRVYNPGNPTGYNITAAGEALGVDSNKRVIENNYVNIKYVLDKNKFNSDKYRIISNAFLEITPATGLAIRSQVSIDYQTGTDYNFLDPVHGDGRSAGGIIVEQNLQRSRYVWQNFLNYNKTFASKHTLGVTAGVEIQRDINRAYNGSATGIADVFFASNNLITNTYATQLSGGAYGKEGFQSYFGRVTYDFENKYFFQFTLRRDGLSSLAPKNRYGNFPGGSLGWRISEEKFWKNGSLGKIINEWKLRGSYAIVGNPLTGFPYLSSYGPAPYAAVAGNAISLVGNPMLKWETNKKIDIGTDISFLNNRFNITVDHFINKNDDLVLQAQTPPSVGIPGNFIFKNIGTMENKGWEFSLTADLLRKKDFSWNASFNITTSKNTVISLVEGVSEQVVPGPNNGNFNILKTGRPVNGFYGYQYNGVNSGNGNAMWLKADGSMVQYNAVSGAAAGYYLVVKPGDPSTGAASSLASTDRQVLGSPVPTWFGGLSNNINYKGLGLELFLRFSGGNKVYNLTRQEVLNSMGFVNNGVESLNRWTPTNTSTDVPKLYYGRDNQINLGGQLNSRFLEKGDFLRLQNVMFYYNFDKKSIERVTNGYVKSIRFFVQGQNLAIWTKYSGIDPENTSELGIDNNSVPQLRTYTIGLNLGF